MTAMGLATARAQQDTQSLNYTSFAATSASPVQIGYYGAAGKDCSPTAPPGIRVIEPPKSGVLTIRPGVLTTDAIKGCGTLKLPARILFYQARAGASGNDHFVYETINADGAVTGYDVTIMIHEVPKTPSPGADKPI